MKDRLRNIASTVLAQAAADPPEWYQEWLQWVHGMLGPPPDQSVGNSAHDEYKVFCLGSILSWGYLAVAAEAEDHEGPDDRDGGGGGVHAAGVLDTTDVAGVPGPELVGRNFTVLGPDGQPIVEGKR